MVNSYDIRSLKKYKSKFSRVDFSKSKIISSLYGRYTNLHIMITIPEWSTVLPLSINIKIKRENQLYNIYISSNLLDNSIQTKRRLITKIIS